MVSVNPSAGNGELFYFQTLLKNVPGATSFDDLRTVHGVIHPTYRSSCVELELLEDDQIWCKSLEEATSWTSPQSLQMLFATILLTCSLTFPLILFNKFAPAMEEDLVYDMKRLLGRFENEKTSRQ